MKELLGQLNKDPQRITKVDRKMVNDLDYKDINFPVSEKSYRKIEQKNNICINAFSFENALTYPIHISYIYISYVHIYGWLIMKINQTKSISKILTNLCSIRQNIKTKSTFADIVYNV